MKILTRLHEGGTEGDDLVVVVEGNVGDGVGYGDAVLGRYVFSLYERIDGIQITTYNLLTDVAVASCLGRVA